MRSLRAKNSFRTLPVCFQRKSEQLYQSRQGNSILFFSGYRPLVDAKRSSKLRHLSKILLPEKNVSLK